MVLLLLTCARHLIVDCTALNSPIYPVTASSRGHKEALCLPNCSPLHSPPSPFLNCLPSVTRSVTSPVILPCVCKLWLFVLKHVNLVEGSPPPPPPPLPPKKKKKSTYKHLRRVESWEGRRSCSGCFLTFSPPPSRRIHPFIHPFRHPSISWRQRRSGLESSNLDYLKKKRWLRGGPSCSVAGALGGDEAQTFWTSPLHWSPLGLGRSPPLPVSHTDTHTHTHQSQARTLTQVQM